MTNEQIAYKAYARSTGGKTFDGRDMPTWEDLPKNIQQAWRAAAEAVLQSNILDNVHQSWPAYEVVKRTNQTGHEETFVVGTLRWRCADTVRPDEHISDCVERVGRSVAHVREHMCNMPKEPTE